MKTRDGFVSNSSSSSYIIALGKIVDLDKFYKYCESNGIKIDGYDVKVWTTDDIKQKDFDEYGEYLTVNGNEGVLKVESFNCDFVNMTIDLTENETFVCVDIANNEGDGAFMSEEDLDDWPEPDYDIDIDFLDESQRALFYMEGVDGLTMSFGADRNG